MAGYIFNIGDKVNVMDIIAGGFYSTYINYSKKKNTNVDYIATGPFEATYADFTSMKENDNVYFFKKRKVYGIGKLIKVGTDCKYNNFVGASSFNALEYTDIKDSLLIDLGADSPHYRWICFFDAAPSFYDEGLDMDEILQYKPSSFKSLRTNWKKTFIKIDDEENQALKELFYLRLNDKTGKISVTLDKECFLEKITPAHLLNYRDLISETIDGDKLIHEMALEAATMEKISLVEDEIFGRWDFETHQVCASPFKPVDYMDKMDIFAYKYTEVADCKVISKYLVIELKKDKASSDTIAQLTNYVDWVCNNYAYGDYSLIESIVLAYDFQSDMYDNVNRYYRTYNMGAHPIKTETWTNIRFVKYYIENGQVFYKDVTKKEDF